MLTKPRAITGIILNVLIILVLGFAFTNGFLNFLKPSDSTLLEYVPWIKGLDFFRFFTNDSNVLLACAALISLTACILSLKGKKIPAAVGVFKLIAVTGTTITMITVFAYLAPVLASPWMYTDYTYNIYVHVVAPALGLLAFIVENKPHLRLRNAFWGILPPALYGAVMVPLVNLNMAADPYGFIKVNPDQWWMSIVWIGGFILGGALIAFLLLLFHNIGSKEAPAEDAIPVEENPVEITPLEEFAPEPEPEPAEEVEPKPTPEPVVAEEKPKTVRRSYHITKQPSGKWQVKLANGEKAIRVFNTQAEAIAFTKGLVESRGGSYHIHSVKGKIRK